jgi:hypothetical protein
LPDTYDRAATEGRAVSRNMGCFLDLWGVGDFGPRFIENDETVVAFDDLVAAHAHQTEVLGKLRDAAAFFVYVTFHLIFPLDRWESHLCSRRPTSFLFLGPPAHKL